MSPIVNRLEDEFQGKVFVQRLDVGMREGLQIQENLGLRGHPAFAILDSNGVLVARYFGIVEEENLRQALESVAPP